MKKSLVMLALATVSLTPVFAGTQTPAQPQQQPTQQTTPAKPVENKKIAGKADEQTTPATPAPTTKPKLMLVADEKPSCCPCPADKKDGQKTPAQTPAKTAAPKVALA